MTPRRGGCPRRLWGAPASPGGPCRPGEASLPPRSASPACPQTGPPGLATSGRPTLGGDRTVILLHHHHIPQHRAPGAPMMRDPYRRARHARPRARWRLATSRVLVMVLG